MNSRIVRLFLLLALLPFVYAAQCGGPPPLPRVSIDSPAMGTFFTTTSVAANGTVGGLPLSIAELTINGVVVPVQPDGTWSTTVTLDPAEVFNPISANIANLLSGQSNGARVTVHYGESVADGAFSPDSIALRLNDSGLDAVEPIITSLVDLDLATLLPPGTLVLDNFCYQDSFLGCLGRVDVTVSGSPPPSIASFSLDMDSQANYVEGDVRLNDLFVRADVVAVTGIGFTCHVNINAATSDIFGDYTLDPDSVDPSALDVAAFGLVDLVFGGFTDDTDCDGFLGGIVEFFINLFIGSIQDLMEPAMENFLNAVDPVTNDTPIAEAVEIALAGIAITGPIGESLGALIESPLVDVPEDVNGITLRSDGKIESNIGPGPEQCLHTGGGIPPDALASLHVPEVFPSWGATTPVGAVPYGMAIGISTSAFNQLLKAETECGLLIANIVEFDLGGGLLPLTTGLLSLFLPEFGAYPPTTPLVIHIRPRLTPVLTGAAGPQGEIGEIQVGNLLVRVEGTSAPFKGHVFLTAAVDFKGGLDLIFDNPTSSLIFNLSTVTASNVDIDLVVNRINTDEVAFVAVMETLLPLLLPQLASSLGAFPLPDFLGLSLQGVEVSKNGDFLAIFTDLVAVP